MSQETEQDLPQISISAQYIKDLSFENAAIPGSIKIETPPTIDLNLDINVSKLSEADFFEVALTVHVKAMHNADVLFILEVIYAGIFHLANIAPEKQNMALGVHCASMLFPYLRKIVADTTQYGGFQPLMMDPIDFSRLYLKRMQENQNNSESDKNPKN